jgi:hypothetical protein
MEGTVQLQNHNFAALNDITDSDPNAKPIIWQIDEEFDH